jgi:hypothetical protein
MPVGVQSNNQFGLCCRSERNVMSNQWNPAAEFPPAAGMYEVHGAPQGKGTFYFDGWHWHLHHSSQATHLDMRSYGCPGLRWRAVCDDTHRLLPERLAPEA